MRSGPGGRTSSPTSRTPSMSSYVLEGRIRLFLREPKEEVMLGPGETYAVRPRRPHLVTNAEDTFYVLLCPRGSDPAVPARAEGGGDAGAGGDLCGPAPAAAPRHQRRAGLRGVSSPPGHGRVRFRPADLDAS